MDKRRFGEVAAAVFILLLAASSSYAQAISMEGEVHFVNDDTSKPLLDLMASSASAQLSRSGKSMAYVGYQISARKSMRKSSWNGRRRDCRNVTVIDGVVFSQYDEGIESVGSEYKLILYRYGVSGSGAELKRIRVLDGGEKYRFTAPLVWLKSVGQARSLAALGKIVSGGRTERIREDALPAVALHEGAEPKRILKSIITGKGSVDLRENALFWFGFTVTKDEIGELQALESSLDHPDLREKLVFVYYLQESDPAITRLIHLARNDKSREVRKQSIFWLGQLAGDRIAAELESIIDDDPDVEIKKQAVFALSQMDTPESLDRLMHVARTNSSPTVRKQALFWISQSGDERAIDLLEQILTK